MKKAGNGHERVVRAGTKSMNKLKSLGGKLGSKITQWGKNRKAQFLGDRDPHSEEHASDDSTDEDNHEESPGAINEKAVSRAVMKDAENEMSSSSASAHSTISDTAAGAPTSGSAMATRIAKLTKHSASLRMIVGKQLFHQPEVPHVAEVMEVADPATSAGSQGHSGRSLGSSLALANRRASYNIFANDAIDNEGVEWISRHDFARRRFVLSSTAWKLTVKEVPNQANQGRSPGVDQRGKNDRNLSNIAEAGSDSDSLTTRSQSPDMWNEQGRAGDNGAGVSGMNGGGSKEKELLKAPLSNAGAAVKKEVKGRHVTVIDEASKGTAALPDAYKAKISKKSTEVSRITLALNGGGGLLMCLLDVKDANPEQICNVSNIVVCKQVGYGPPYDDVFMIMFTNQNTGELVEAHFAVSSPEVLQNWTTLLMPCKAAKTGTDMFKQMRAMVSGNRRRYQEDGFDLDLSYITKRCIAMAFPGQDTVGPFSIALRNDMKDVRRFFDEKHRGCYKIFNLCAEKTYDAANFNGRVEHIPFLDHNPPTLRQLKHFCNLATRWCKQRGNNVVAVHCKGGKGRTGVVVACWLMFDSYTKAAQDGSLPMTVDDAVEVFTKRRTQDENGQPQGPTCTSQLRYVEYFRRALNGKVPNRVFRITQVRMVTVPILEKSAYYRPFLRISCAGREVYSGSGTQQAKVKSVAVGSMETVVIDLSDSEVFVNEDFKVEMFNGKVKYSEDEQRLADKATFFLCVHTGMVGESPLVFNKMELDGPQKDKSCKRFRAELALEIDFEERSLEQKTVVYNEDIETRVLELLYLRSKAFKVRSGETLCVAGDQADQRIFIIAEGSVRVEKLTGDGHVVLEDEPFMCGEESFLLTNCRSVDIVTNQDTLAYAIKPTEVTTIFGDDAAGFYHLLAIHLSYKQAWRSSSTALIKQATRNGEPCSKKYSNAHSLPQSETVIASGKCFASSHGMGRGMGMLVIMRRYVLFHATSWTGGTSHVICTRDILRVEGPKTDVGSGGVVCLTVRQARQGTHRLDEIKFSFSFIHVASEIVEHLKEVSRRLHDFRMISLTKSSDLAAHTVLPEIFGSGEWRTIERYGAWAEIKSEGSDVSQRLYCVLNGHLLVRNMSGGIVDRLEVGDMMGEVAFIEQDTWRAKKHGNIVAGKDGVIVVSVSFDHIRAMLEANIVLAERFYEYVTKVMYRRLRDSLYTIRS